MPPIPKGSLLVPVSLFLLVLIGGFASSSPILSPLSSFSPGSLTAQVSGGGGVITGSGISLGNLNVSANRIPAFYPPYEAEAGYTAAKSWPEYDVTCQTAPCTSGKQPYTNAPGMASCSVVTQSSFGMNCMISSAPNNSVLYLPSGTYNTGQGMLVGRSNVVIRGAGRNATIITRTTTGRSFLAGDCGANSGAMLLSICSPSFVGTNASWTGGFTRGSTVFQLSSVAGFMVGGWAKLSMTANASCFMDKPLNAGGYPDAFVHLAKVTGVNTSNNTITLDRALRLDYGAAGCTGHTASPVTPVQNVGVENLRLTTSTAIPVCSDSATCIKFPPLQVMNTASSWLVNNTVDRAWESWSVVEQSARIWFQGNDFDNLDETISFNTEGILTNQGAVDIVYENNTCGGTRVCHENTNGNNGTVIAYNYWRQNQSICEKAFFSHGHYSHENLLEGNDTNCNLMIVDSWWGRNGPRNTAYRNRNVSAECHSDRDAITVNRDGNTGWPAGDLVNIIGNTSRQYFNSPGLSNPDCGSQGGITNVNTLVMSNIATNIWVEKNAWRLPNGTFAIGNLNNPSCGTGANDACPGTNKNVSAPDSSWNGTYPISLYRASAPSWWCQEACPWSQNGIGAFGDNFNGTLCKLPAEIRANGGTCTPMSGTVTPTPPPPTPTPTNGTCGSANGSSFTTSPTTNLCSQGTPSSVTTGSSYTWSCSGTNGGSTASCSASISVVTPPPPPPPTSQTPIGEWLLNENTGSSASDSSGNGNTGILTNGPLWTPGRNGSGIDLDGVNDFIHVNTSAPFNLTNDLTLSAWIRHDTNSGADSLFGKGGCYNLSCPFNLRVTGSGALAFSQNSGLSTQEDITTTATIPLSTWTHIAATRQSGAVSLYINGTRVTGSTGTTRTPTANQNTLTLGSTNAQGTDAFDGAIDEPRIWNRALSQTEIQALIGGVTPPPPPPPPPTGDTTSPTVSFLNPAQGTVITSPIVMSVNASDNVGVTQVTFSLNGTPIGTDTTSPFSLSFDPTTRANGTYTFSASASDAAGNTASTQVTATIQNPVTTPPPPPPPTPVNGTCGSASGTSVTSPPITNLCSSGTPTAVTTNPSTYTWSCSGTNGGTTASCSATRITQTCGNNIVEGTEVCDGTNLNGRTCQTQNYTGGTLSCTACAFNISQCTNTVPDTSGPTVSLTSPASGVSLPAGQSLTISASASDPSGIRHVEFLLNTTSLVIDTTAPYTTTWVTTAGSHTITARGVDTLGNITNTTASITVTPPPTLVNGSCGSSNGSSFTTAPSTNLCSSGTPSSVTTNTSTYTWSCPGTNGGTTAQCSATRTIVTTPPPAPPPIPPPVPPPSGGGGGGGGGSVSDAVPPTVSLFNPTQDQTLSGTIVVSALAQDNIAILNVTFRLDGTEITTDTTYPYSATLNTMTSQNGPHTLSVVARDTSGNIALASVNVRFQNTGGGNGSGGTPPPPKKDVFEKGTSLTTTDTIRVRATPGGTPITTFPQGTTGTVIDGPITQGEYTWVKMQYPSGQTGWSATLFLAPTTKTTVTPTTPTTPPTSTPYSFPRNLRLGMEGDDVRNLQRVLNQDPRTLIAQSGPGSKGQESTFFGLKTKAAVIRYQNLYPKELLIPAGLTEGTGFVGSLTRKKMGGI